MATTKHEAPAISVPDEIIKQLDRNVVAVVGAKEILGFQKAFLVSDAIGKLKDILTPEYMKPIMNLQGNRLGFKTDKDSAGGYPEAAVKNCLIEAVLIGLQPVGNQFNIIAGNMYPTKEGFGYLLANMEGLRYEIIADLPRIKPDSTGAAIVMNIEWAMNGGTKQKRAVDFPVKMNAHMGTDAVIGKATRKARAWLFNTINGTEIPDGDVQDADARVMSSKITKSEEDIEIERGLALIKDCKTVAELIKLAPTLPEGCKGAYEEKMSSFLD